MLDEEEKELFGKKTPPPYLGVINNKAATGTLSQSGVVQGITGWKTNQFIMYTIYHITLLGAALRNFTWFKTY